MTDSKVDAEDAWAFALDLQARGKSREIEQFLEDLAVESFGIGRAEAFVKVLCVSCGKSAARFDDEVSAKEYKISGFCQGCQNEVWDLDGQSPWNQDWT